MLKFYHLNITLLYPKEHRNTLKQRIYLNQTNSFSAVVISLRSPWKAGRGIQVLFMANEWIPCCFGAQIYSFSASVLPGVCLSLPVLFSKQK